METTNPKINGITAEASKGSIILGAARLTHIEIPILCFSEEVSEIGAYRICIVELRNGKLVISCVYPAEESMEVYTNTSKALDPKKETLQFLLSNCNRSCPFYVRGGHCELQELVHELGVDDEGYHGGETTPSEIDISVAHMTRDNSKCILCRRYAVACEDVQGIGAAGINSRESSTSTGSAFEMSLGEAFCVSCGQCIVVCPTEALTEKDYITDVFIATTDPKKRVIVQTAPTAHIGLGEEFGLPIGTDVEGKMAVALRRLGFDEVLDTNSPADLVVMEEVHRSIDRVQSGGILSLITSCSSGWVKYCEYYPPDMTENLSSCKSPQRMFGTIAKSYYTEKAGANPRDIVSVSIMPCIARKFETGREDEDANEMPDVDISITTRELAYIIKKAGIKPLDLPDEEFDVSLGLGTGVAAIFGITGGTVEAILRTAVEAPTGGKLPKLDFTEVRDTKGIKEAAYNVADMEVKIAVTSGLGSARELLNKVKSGEVNYHFIEVMGCPGDCVNGGGQPQQPEHVRNTTDIRGLCAGVLYDIDTVNPIRKSHENSAIKEFYATYLGKPGSEKTHHLLRTTHAKRSINQH